MPERARLWQKKTIDMHIEFISLLGAIIGASMSLTAGILSRMQKHRLREIAWNCKQEDPESSMTILEHANQDIRDLQLQIKKLEGIMREKS